MFKNQKILICPLNWGIGHTTRMVAFARDLERNDNTVVVAGDYEVLAIFEDELPHVKRFYLKDVNIRYSESNKTVRKIFFHLPLFIFPLVKQHYELQRLLDEIDVDVVISDNRPTLWTRKKKSYYVSHQPNVKLTEGWHWAERLATKIHQWLIRRFDALLIPDVEGQGSLSGALSRVNDKRICTYYIGWLSRFEKYDLKPEKDDYTLLILSGVEPSRSQLKNDILKRYQELGEQLIIVGDKTAENLGNITTLPYVRSEALKPLMLSAKHIICRSGYSMIMDLEVLGCKAELIPTPGQPEQEYLAKLHSKR